MNFCHLHCHNEFSLLDGFGKAEEWAKRAKDLGFKYLGLTNHGNIDGLIKFDSACKKEGIIPIFGCEMYLTEDMTLKQKGVRSGHMTVLIKNQTGWKELNRLLTIANLEGYYYRPRIDYEAFLDADLSGFVIMSACAGSFLRLDDSKWFVHQLLDRGVDLFFEIMPHQIKAQKEIHELIDNIYLDDERIADNVPLIATNDCHYIFEEDAESQEVLLAIQTKAHWKDKKRFKFGFDGLYLRTEDEMYDAFIAEGYWSKEFIDEALDNTIKVAEMCEGFTIPKLSISLPESGQKGVDADVKLQKMVYTKFNLKLAFNEINEFEVSTYKDRIKEELDLIKSKQFSEYFLIVKDVIDWARQQDIMVGPGRGSVGGSLVAYFLGITQINPLDFNLLFSRFIAEHRNDYPDIDIDFQDSRRDEVKEYLKMKYGEWNTAGISTFSTMAARRVLRDVTRVFYGSDKEVDEFCKVIPYFDKDKFKVKKYAEETDEGRAFDKKNSRIIDHAIYLENQVANAGQHAAGIIVSKEDLREGDRCNLIIRNKQIMCNWDMEDSEKMGLMKLDILGLNCLSILNEAQRLMIENNGDHFWYHDESNSYFLGPDSDSIPEEDYDINLFSSNDLGKFEFIKIPLDDQNVFDEITAGSVMGVFQFSGWATRKVCMDMGIHNFDSLVAAVALSRPGPMESGMTQNYIDRKHRLQKNIYWESKHKIYEDITKDTYGVLVYQEQVMQVISGMAGMTYSEADKVRKIISKKRDAEEFKPYWEKFLAGCLDKRTMNEREAEEFWNGLQEWAGYGFNKSHSVAYALIGYWCAYIKYYYPTEFICASLTYGTDNKKEDLIQEAVRLGLTLIPPKIGISDAKVWVAQDKKLFIPFIEIKGIGETKAMECVGKKKDRARNAKNQGFFKNNEVSFELSPSLKKLLESIGAFDPEAPLPEDAEDKFDFTVNFERKKERGEKKHGRTRTRK